MKQLSKKYLSSLDKVKNHTEQKKNNNNNQTKNIRQPNHSYRLGGNNWIELHDPYTILWKLPSYPFLKPTFCPKWEVSVNVHLGEGYVGSFPETYNDPFRKGVWVLISD